MSRLVAAFLEHTRKQAARGPRAKVRKANGHRPDLTVRPGHVPGPALFAITPHTGSGRSFLREAVGHDSPVMLEVTRACDLADRVQAAGLLMVDE